MNSVLRDWHFWSRSRSRSRKKKRSRSRSRLSEKVFVITITITNVIFQSRSRSQSRKKSFFTHDHDHDHEKKSFFIHDHKVHKYLVRVTMFLITEFFNIYLTFFFSAKYNSQNKRGYRNLFYWNLLDLFNLLDLAFGST